MTRVVAAPEVSAPSRLAGGLAGFAILLIWSGWIVLSRMGVKTALTPYDITALRFGSAALVTAPLWWRFPWQKVRWERALVVGLSCGFPYTLLVFLGLQTSRSAEVGVLVNGSLPIMGAAVFAVWFKRAIPGTLWLTCALLLTASLCMLGADRLLNLLLGGARIVGIAQLLLAALALAVYMTAVTAWNMTSREVLVLVPLVNAVLFVPVWFLCLPSTLETASRLDVVVQAAYQGLVVSVAGLVLFTVCVRALGPVASALFMAFVPASTALLGWFALGEVLSPWQIGGIVLCTVALVGHAVSGRQRAGRGPTTLSRSSRTI